MPSSPSSASSRVTRSPKVRMVCVVGRVDAADPDRPLVPGRDRVAPQPRRDLADQHRVLGPLVLGVSEHERQQLLAQNSASVQ